MEALGDGSLEEFEGYKPIQVFGRVDDQNTDYGSAAEGPDSVLEKDTCAINGREVLAG